MAFADGAAGALEDERVRLLELEAVRELVGANQRDEGEVVVLERPELPLSTFTCASCPATIPSTYCALASSPRAAASSSSRTG